MKQEQVEHVRAIFERHADAPYLLEPASGRSLTYGGVSLESRRIAAWLSDLGAGPGDLICFLSANSLELALLMFGTWQCGAGIVPINPQLATPHVRRIVENASPKLIIGNPELLATHREAISNIDESRLIGFDPAPDANLRGVAANVGKPLGNYYEGYAPVESDFRHWHDRDIFMRVYTSGSTAAPKGIDIAIGPLLGNERLFCSTMGIGPGNRFYNILPMSYLGGVHNLLLLPLSAGASVIIDEPLGPTNLFGFWETVKAQGINTLWFTSAMLSMLMQLRDEDDLSWISDKIRLGLVGMAPLPVDTKRDFELRFGIRLHENYALSETAFISSTRPGQPQRPSSKGAVFDGVRVAVVDEQLNAVPHGEVGEILVATPYLMKGYVNADQQDLENIRPEGFLTGDLGRIDEDELFIVGRKKDLIIRGGLNIAPAGVEEALTKVPWVSEVAVVGIDHPVYGEEVAAAVTLKPDAPADVRPKDLIKACEGVLAFFQRPKKVKILPEMPKGMTGKTDKKAIRMLFDPPAATDTR